MIISLSEPNAANKIREALLNLRPVYLDHTEFKYIRKRIIGFSIRKGMWCFKHLNDDSETFINPQNPMFHHNLIDIQ